MTGLIQRLAEIGVSPSDSEELRVRKAVLTLSSTLIASLAFVWVGGNWPALYPAAYFARTVIVGVMLWLFWPHYTRVRWNHWWLGLIVGLTEFATMCRLVRDEVPGTEVAVAASVAPVADSLSRRLD